MAEKQIVCCTDFSENAEPAFITALEMAEKYQTDASRLVLLCFNKAFKKDFIRACLLLHLTRVPGSDETFFLR